MWPIRRCTRRGTAGGLPGAVDFATAALAGIATVGLVLRIPTLLLVVVGASDSGPTRWEVVDSPALLALAALTLFFAVSLAAPSSSRAYFRRAGRIVA
jgi:hypothetical protein